MKAIGKFLMWALAYAMGAALIFFLAPSPAPSINIPKPAPVAEAPPAPSVANQPTAPDETQPPRGEEAAPPATAPDTTAKPPSTPRRVKAIRIPSR